MRIIGLMSGTSVDGIDAALVDVTGEGYAISAKLIKGVVYPYSEEVRSRILSLCDNQPIAFAELAELDDEIAYHFVQATQALEIDLATVDLIGSHGQTLYHRPPSANQLGYTQQLGRGDLIARTTGCTTVSNFRVADIALGGQGAPLVPIIDACLLAQPDIDIAVQNIGGIGNVTYLPAWNLNAKTDAKAAPTVLDKVQGWDTGPGNALIDWAITTFSKGQKSYDENGDWAATGIPNQPLIDRWLAQPFFQTSPPKSTGRELFGVEYAEHCWQAADARGLSPEDFLSTLTDFTAATIELSYRQFLPNLPKEVLIGGGGSQNKYLMNCLRQRLPECSVQPTDNKQIDANYKEAIAFAVLAYWRWYGVPSNLPSVTGADRPCLLGEIWTP
ncbi:MAG: anhydro-N-acetylmuramic acid kinase [Cyanobacteria bacterium P01_D01_bin.1]